MPLSPLLLLALLSMEKGERRLDGGPVVSGGFELAVTHVRSTGGGITGAATLVSVLTVYQADWNFTRWFGLGLRAGGGGILNSDIDSFHAFVGPTVTFYLGRLFYLGVDAWLQAFRFDDVSASVHGTEDVIDGEETDLDGDFLLGFDFGARLGFVIEIANVVTIVPELRFGVQPVTPVRLGADLDYVDSLGPTTIEGDRVLTIGGGLGVAVRAFF